ncbi:MAG: type II toxin-antitoxin system RelE/ParE family toxin [Gammaproteobacteria bacterium]
MYLQKQYRHLIIGAYRIIFRIENEYIFIVRIIHGAKLANL